MSLKFSFNNHDDLKGTHALFSPSQSSWMRYDEEKIAEKVRNQYRAPLGTEIHEYAASQIILEHNKTSVKNIISDVENYIYTKYTSMNDMNTLPSYALKLIKNVGTLPKEVFEAVKLYINDGIGYRMTVEQPVVYSKKIYGTADSIIFKNNLLRIHDLKTGFNPAHMEQLEGYAALFCLEYGIKPSDIQFELRLYQWDGVLIHKPTVEDLLPIIDQIIFVNKNAEKFEKENE